MRSIEPRPTRFHSPPQIFCDLPDCGCDLPAPPEREPERRAEIEERHWVYSDLGHHWLEDGSSSYHDNPCDHPEEHLGPEDR